MLLTPWLYPLDDCPAFLLNIRIHGAEQDRPRNVRKSLCEGFLPVQQAYSCIGGVNAWRLPTYRSILLTAILRSMLPRL